MKHHDTLAALNSAAGWRKSTRSQQANACVEVTDQVPGWIRHGASGSRCGARRHPARRCNSPAET